MFMKLSRKCWTAALLLPAVCFAPTAGQAQTATNIISWDFNSDSNLTNFKDKIASEFDDRLTRVTEGSTSFMRVVVKPDDGNYKTTNNLSEEITLFTNKADAPAAGRLTYKMRFNSDFDFVRQGKLPGMSSFIPHYGGNAPDAPVSYSWSYRNMWFPGTPAIKRPDIYIYDQNRIQGDSGAHYTTPENVYVYPKDQWFTVKMEFQLNTLTSSGSPRSDGIARMFIGSTQVKCVDGLKFRGSTLSGHSDDWRFGRLAFHVYHGGQKGTTELPPASNTSYVDFDYLNVESLTSLSSGDAKRKC
jgi:hypothetical protein